MNHYYENNDVCTFVVFYDIYNIHVYKNFNDVLRHYVPLQAILYRRIGIKSNTSGRSHTQNYKDKVNSVKQRKPHRPHENTLFLHTPHRLNCFITIK